MTCAPQSGWEVGNSRDHREPSTDQQGNYGKEKGRHEIKAQPVSAAEMVKALRSIMLPARAERGFVSSRVYQEVDKPEALCYVEE